MSDEAIPTTPNNSDIATTENASKGYLLAQQLCNLQQENIVVGKQNQELALQLHDASNYNQALGLDLYQLDQEIGELEERLSNMKNQIKEIDQQTKTITKKADEYKNALRNDKEFSSLARHLRSLQKTHQAASKSLSQLRELLGDPNFSMLDGALQLMQEKIHFLYWSNTELHQQIELMQQLLNEGREGAIIEEDLEKMNDLSNYKLEYYDMKLFESQMKNGIKKGEKSNINDTDSSSDIDSAKYILSPSKNKKPFTQKNDKELNSKSSRKFKGNKGYYEDVLIQDKMNEKNYRIFRRPLKSDGKRRKYQKNNSKTKKYRQTRVQNKNGDEYEYQYEYDYSDVNENDNKNNKNGKKIRVKAENEEIERINAKQEDFDKFKKTQKFDKNETEEDKEKNKKRNQKTSKKDDDDDDDDNDNDYEYEYQYEAETKETTKSQKSKTNPKINNSEKRKKTLDKNDNDMKENDNQYPIIEEEEEEIDSEYNDSEGFSHRRNQKTGKIERYRRFEFSDGKEYEDVIIPDYEQSKTKIKMKRNRIDKKNNTYKHVKKKDPKSNDKFIISRHERVLHNNDEEYEYEYEYECDEDNKKAKNRPPKRYRVSTSSEIIPTFNNEDENGFRIQTTTNSKNRKEKKKIRKYKDDNGQTYKDTIEKNENTGEFEVHRRATKSETNDSLKYSTKKNKFIRHSRSHDLTNGNEVEYEYEYEIDENNDRNLFSKNKILNPDDEIIPPIVLKSELRANRRDQQGFGDIELNGDKKEIRKRKVKGKNGINYEDILESDLEDGTQRISRRIKNGDKLQYAETNKKGKSKPVKTRRTRVQNDDKEEYEYEYEYDDEERKKNRVSKKDELIEEIGDGPINKFKKQTDKKTGETVLSSKVKGKDGSSSYEDVISVNDQGETVITRRLLSKDDDNKFQYSQKTVTDENGHKKKLRVRRSKVKHEDGHEEEFEYEYDDNENTKTRKLVPKKDESIESITGVPKLSKKDKQMLTKDKKINNDLLSNFGFKDEIDQKTGRKKKVRITEDVFGQKYEYSKEQDPQTKETRVTKRKLEPNGEKLKYEIFQSKDSSQILKMRKSEARIGDSEREYEYEYNENDEDQGERKKLPKKDKDGFYKGKNYRVVLCDDGKEYEDTRIKGKIYRRPFLSSNKKNRHTRVRNADDEEYEYEYESGYKKVVSNINDEIIPHIKLSSRPRSHKVGPDFALFKGIEIRRINGADGNEYEDEKIGRKIKRSKLNQDGQIEYKKLKINNKGKKKQIKQRHVLVLNSDDDEIEYEYQYEFDSESNENPKKSRNITDEREIESILKRPDFQEKTDPKTKKSRFIRQVIGSNGDIYEDEEDQKKNRIIRRKLDKEGSSKYFYKNHKNNRRTRHSRIAKLSPLNEDEEYEYEYEYNDKTGEVQRQKATNEIFEPIEKLNSKRYISDSSQISEEEEEDPETGEKKNIVVLKHQNVEKIINPTTGKPMKVRKNGKDYEVVFNPKTNKTLRQRKMKLDNDDELVFEYDDNDLDENGNPRKIVKRINNDEQQYELDSEGFYEDKKSNGIKTRRVKGKNGSFYIDTIENEGRIRRRVVNSLSSNDLIYRKKNNNKIVRHSRVHDERGDEKEYEYEYENDDDDTYTRKIVTDESKHEIEVIKKNDFKEKKDPQTGEKIKNRIKKGKDGELYEDTIKNNRIFRRPLQKNNQKLKYNVDENGIKTRRSRVRNENNDEYEYEYEDDNGKVTKTRVHPDDEKIERIDGSKTYKGGFFDQFETVNGSITDDKRKVRKVKGSNNQIFEDELVGDKIKRRPLNRKGKISYKRKNDKTIRRQRVKNRNGDEYEYEYEYDEEENREKYRVDPNDEIIEQISVSDNEYDYEYDEDENEGLDGFLSQKNEKTGELEKSRKITNNKNGHVYKDTIEKNEDTGEDEIHRRLMKSESTDELEYLTKPGKNNENKVIRHSRTHNLATGDETEYEYEYETDKKGDKSQKGKKKKIINPDEEIIQSIMIVHKPKKIRNKKKKEDNDDDDNTNLDKKNRKNRSKSPSKENQSELPLDSENGLNRFHIPVSLFQSEDPSKPKPKLQQSNPSSTHQPKPAIIDFSEYESKVNPDKKNPLALLIPKLRAESGVNNDDINSPENLQRILELLQQQIAERTEIRDQLKARIKELENPHYVKKNTATAKKAKNFKMSGIRRVNIESPPDPIKVLALNNYDLRHIGSQTDLTGETINYHQSVLDKQRREKRAAEELRLSLEALKEQIRTVEGKIERAKEDGQIKEERIKTLKTEIVNVKDELLKEDKNTLREEEKAREYAQQLSEIDEQIRIKQQQMEKINSQVGALHLHLKEMQKFRVILESELANLVNREKPEIRQLIEDVNSYRIQIDVSSANVESMTKKVEAKRQQLEELLSSDEMNQYNELRLKKINLERRIKKWSSLMKDSRETLQSIETFSAKNANARKNAIEQYKSKVRSFMKLELELDDLEKYQELVESMIREHKQNWM